MPEAQKTYIYSERNFKSLTVYRVARYTEEGSGDTLYDVERRPCASDTFTRFAFAFGDTDAEAIEFAKEEIAGDS